MKYPKPALHPLFDQILTDFVQQEPCEDVNQNIIATSITEIRGNMSDREFSDALNAFTNGEYHPAPNTIQKYRTGQREPRYGYLRIILAYGKAGGHLSSSTSMRLANFFSIAELQALPTRNEIYLEQHESREELGILHSDYGWGGWF